ncbi:MAG: Uma2 family endonuclease [Isosphaeraceae bacterium]
MSTIPRRSRPSPTGARKRSTPSSPASFENGYRLVRRPERNGRAGWQRIPLTLEDMLHPQEGDVHVLSDPHADDCTYSRIVLKDRYAGDQSVAVLSDCGIYWDIPRLKHHSPDLAVIFGVKRRKGWRTFHVKTEKVRPALIIEVTSPNTRVNDVETKVKEYARARVPYYVIVDADEEHGPRKLTLLSYRLKGAAYERVQPDEKGRVWLEPVGLWLAVKVNSDTGGDCVAFIDPATGSEIGDYTAIRRAREEAQARATQAETRATQAETRAAAAADARAAAEERSRQLEAELLRLRRRKS